MGFPSIVFSLTLSLSPKAGEGIGISAVTLLCNKALAKNCLESEQSLRIGKKNFLFDRVLEIHFIKADQRFL